MQPQTNVTFKNLYSYCSMRAIAINHRSGTAPAENITVDNIDIEGFSPRAGNQSRWLEIYSNSDGPLGNVTIANCNVRTAGSAGSVLKGHSATGMVSGVTFWNIRINGTLAESLAALNITQTNAFAEDIRFATGDTRPGR